MNPDCFPTSGEQTKGRDRGMMHGGGEREGEWEEIENSLALHGAISVLAQVGKNGEQRGWGVCQRAGDGHFSSSFTAHFLNIAQSPLFSPLCLSIA